MELSDPETGLLWGLAQAWATGQVQPWSGKRPFRDREPVSSTWLSAHQVRQRDKDVEAKVQEIVARRGALQGAAEIDKLTSAAGSKGQSELAKSGLPYWDELLFTPCAVYHTTYLGPAKDFMRWVMLRLGVGDTPKEPLVLPFQRPRDIKKLLHARRAHFVLRNKPDCIMADFTQHLGGMSMSEMQLLYEVGVPYLCHDLVAFGVPRPVVVMMLLLRHGMMCFTRLLSNTADEYKEQLRLGTACLFAYGAVAEFFHRRSDAGVNQFSFSWKLHKLQHLEQQLLRRGHAVQSNDTWVERLMRHKACLVCKYVPTGNPVLCADKGVSCDLGCTFRDRASKDTEGAIQKAHEDNHSGKAMEVLLSHAQQNGTHFCPELPLVPTLQEVSCLLTKETRAQLQQDRGGRPTRPRVASSVVDAPQQGEYTFFLGRGKPMRLSAPESREVLNAFGFLMYIACEGNARGEWPATMGTCHGCLCFGCSILNARCSCA